MEKIIFEREKFFRTYIGGSRKAEREYLESTEGLEKDKTGRNWYKLKENLTFHFRDRLNVSVSWRYLMKNLSILFLAAGIAFYQTAIVSIILIGFVLCFVVVYYFLQRKEDETIRNFDFCIAVVDAEIKDILKKQPKLA